MRRTPLQLITALFCILLNGVQTLAVAGDKLIIRVDGENFPATYRRDHQWQGMDIEFINTLLLHAGFEYDIVELPFPRSLLQIEQGMIHVIPNLVKNQARSEYMNWLGPNRITCIGLVVQQKDLKLEFESTDDLIRIALDQQKRIGYLTGASYSHYLDERLKHDALLRKVLYFLPDNAQHRQMLQLGRLLGFFHDVFEIQKRLQDPAFSRDYEGLALHTYQIEESCTGAYLGISKKVDPLVYEKLLKAFDEMKRDGSFAEIHRKWVGHDPDF